MNTIKNLMECPFFILMIIPVLIWLLVSTALFGTNTTDPEDYGH